MSGALRNDTGTVDNHRYGVLILANGDGRSLRGCLASVQAYEVAPIRVAIVDRGKVAALDRAGADELTMPAHYWWTGDDLGVGGSIEVGLRYLSDCDVFLIVDDQAMLGPKAAQQMLACLTDGIGAVVGRPSSEGNEAPDVSHVHGQYRLRWFPSALDADVVKRVGPPLAELFSQHDDLEYGLRMSRHGYSVISNHVDMTSNVTTHNPQALYLSARNLTYLIFHRRLWASTLLQDWVRLLRMAARPRAALERKGLRDGLRSYVGPPPSDI